MSKYLKTTSVFLVLFFSIHQLFSQRILAKDIQGEWIKDKISLEDGSAIYDQEILNSSFGLEFSGDTVIISVSGKSSISTFSIRDSVLSYRGNYFKIERFEKPILELTQMVTGEDIEPIKLQMVYKPTFDIGLTPEAYLAKNGEPVYIFRPNEIEPKFINFQYSAIDFIHSNFKYPEFRKGGFVVRFVITKTGEIEGQRVIASSNPKYDQRLIDAVNKTAGKWRPAKYLGENVNCEVEYNFDLGYTKPSYSGDDEELKKAAAADYAENGRYYFTAKNYRSAIYYLTKAIENDPYSINSYYLRAAAYIYTKKTDSACGDYLQLKNLEQKRAENLYDKYCKDYSAKSPE